MDFHQLRYLNLRKGKCSITQRASCTLGHAVAECSSPISCLRYRVSRKGREGSRLPQALNAFPIPGAMEGRYLEAIIKIMQRLESNHLAGPFDLQGEGPGIEQRILLTPIIWLQMCVWVSNVCPALIRTTDALISRNALRMLP